MSADLSTGAPARSLPVHALIFGGCGGLLAAGWMWAALRFEFIYRPFIVFGVVIPIGCIVFGVQRWRDRGLGGTIRFSQAAGAGLAIGLVLSAMAGAYVGLHAAWLEPELVEKLALLQADALRTGGQTAEFIATADAGLRAQYSPGRLALSVLRSQLPVVLVIALVAAAFVRKQVR